MSNNRLTKRQKKIIEAMREGATLWHPYVRASSRFAYLAGEEISEQIKYSTIDKLIDIGVIEEIVDNNPDVRYRLKQ